MTDVKLYDLTGVEVFDVGTWNGKTWTSEDLDEMVANFEALAAAGYDFPAKISHDEAQALIANSELPAAGYITRLYRSGTKLAADFTRIPAKFKTCIELGAYRTVSAEIFDAVQLLGKTWKNVVRAVAFLGAEIPAVGTLDDVIALYHRPARPLVFSELAGATRVFVSYAKEEGMKATAAARPAAPKGVIRTAIATLRSLFAGESFDEQRELVMAAVRAKWGDGIDGYGPWISDMFVDRAIVSRDGKDWSVPYTVAEDKTVTLGEPVEVEQTWTPVAASTPAANADPAGETGDMEEEADMATSKAILSALGLPENADEQATLAAIAGLKVDKVEFTTLATKVQTLEGTLTQNTAKTTVADAIKAKKILPAQREWAETYAAKDPAGFAAFVEKAPEVLETGERGSSGDAPEATSEVAQFRAKVAELVKGGKSVADAQAEVAASEPELYAAVRGRR